MSDERLAYLDALAERVREKRRELIDLRGRSERTRIPRTEADEPSALHAAWEALRAAWIERIERRPLSNAPLISIAIAAGADESSLLGTLLSIAATWFESLAVEIVVSVESEARAERIRTCTPGVRAFVRNDAASDARAVAVAHTRGVYLFLLGEGVRVTNGCLDRLVTLLESDRSIGIASARVVTSNGAFDDGSIATADGVLVPVAVRATHARDRRDVDIAPVGALLVRRDRFDEFGAFDPRFVSERYRLAHLCLAARAAGLGVVVHTAAHAYADATHDLDRVQLARVHRALLAPRSSDPAHASAATARSTRTGEVLLAVLARLPIGGWENDPRTFAMLRAWRERGYYVAVLPDDGVLREPAAEELAALGIELLCGPNFASGGDAALAGLLPILAVAWLFGEDVLDQYAERIRLNRAVTIVYDADVRTYGRARVLDLARRADAVACARGEDVRLLRRHGLDATLVDASNAADLPAAVRARVAR